MSPSWNPMSRTFGLSAAALVTALTGIPDAHAVVIGASLDNVTSFLFSVSDPSATEQPNRTTGINSASFNGPAVSNTVNCGMGFPNTNPPCNFGLAANAPQATAGPGPFPGQDVFTKPPAGGFVGSRGDQNITSIFNPMLGASASGVAESRVSTPGTVGPSASNEIVSTVAFAAACSAPFRFSLSANPFLQGGGDQTGDTALAAMSLAVRLTNAQGVTTFLWTPGVSSGQVGVASQTVPFSLNQQLMATAPGGNTIFSPA